MQPIWEEGSLWGWDKVGTYSTSTDMATTLLQYSLDWEPSVRAQLKNSVMLRILLMGKESTSHTHVYMQSQAFFISVLGILTI